MNTKIMKILSLSILLIFTIAFSTYAQDYTSIVFPFDYAIDYEHTFEEYVEKTNCIYTQEQYNELYAIYSNWQAKNDNALKESVGKLFPHDTANPRVMDISSPLTIKLDNGTVYTMNKWDVLNNGFTFDVETIKCDAGFFIQLIYADVLTMPQVNGYTINRCESVKTIKTAFVVPDSGLAPLDFSSVKGTQKSKASFKAIPTSTILRVNGEYTRISAYNINGNNYYKLRDLSYAVTETAKQFDISYDDKQNTISLYKNKFYSGFITRIDFDQKQKAIAKGTNAKIIIDDVTHVYTAFNINDYNYFKLRDIAALFDFDVEWIESENTVNIVTSRSYTQP